MKLDRVLSLLLTTEQGLRIGMATAALFAVLALASLITMLGSWWADAQLSSVKGTEALAIQDLSSPMHELIQAVPQAHLFGHRLPPSAYVPITSSQLRLMGIIQQGSAEEENPFSKAIISVQGSIGRVYQVGDVLSGGIKIMGIQADAVILDNNGHSERLPLQRPTLERN